MQGLLGEPKDMHKTRINSLILSTFLIVSLPAYAHNSSAVKLHQSTSIESNLIADTTSIDLISAGVTLFNSLINPPSRSAEITADAEVKKARIAADAEIAKEKLRLEANKSTDRVTPVLNQWGVARVTCAPSLVFINGITTDTVCIQPNSGITAGYYSYDSAKQRLVRTNTNIQTIQTIQNVQNTRVSNSTDRGF
jgi:hypothetical protein